MKAKWDALQPLASNLQPRYDVVIGGGGVIGLAAAYYLSREGAKVLLVERDVIGAHASGNAAGLLTPYAEAALSEPLQSFAIAGLLEHRRMAGILQEESGIDVELRHVPVLRVALEPGDVEELQSRQAWQTARGLKGQWLSAGEARVLEPRVSESLVGGLLSEDEAMLDGYRLLHALERAARAHGAQLSQGEVIGATRSGERLQAVVTKDGEVPCERAILALGPWTASAADWLGWPVPVYPLRGQLLRGSLMDGPPMQAALFWRGSYVFQGPSGLLTFGTTEERAGFESAPTAEGRRSIEATVQRLAPSLASARILSHTACLRPASEDGAPLIGPAPGWDGLYLATGHGRKGILTALVTARLLVELVAGRQPEPPFDGFAPDRLSQPASNNHRSEARMPPGT